MLPERAAVVVAHGQAGGKVERNSASERPTGVVEQPARSLPRDTRHRGTAFIERAGRSGRDERLGGRTAGHDRQRIEIDGTRSDASPVLRIASREKNAGPPVAGADREWSRAISA